MLRDIVRKEIMDNISTLKFVVTFMVITILVISGLVIGSRNYLKQKGIIEERLQRNYEMLSNQSNWIWAGYIGILQTKTPYVLSTFDNGIDNSLGRQAQVNIDMTTRLDESRNLTAPILAVFGDVDLTFIVEIILSLFVILLTYDAVSGEKERGTLKLELASEVPRYKFLLGKILGGFSVISFSFLFPLLLGFLVLMGFYPQVLGDFTSDAWVRFLIIIFVYILYLIIFFAVGLFVSSICHRSSTSFIILLMIWIFFVTIIPQLSLATAEKLRPYEAYTTLQTKGLKEIAQERVEMMKRFEEEQRRAGQISPGALGELFARMFENESLMQQEVMEKYDRQFDRQQSDQMSLAKTLSRTLSPTAAMSLTVQNLAGSGWKRQQDYVEQLRAFQKEYREYVLEQIANTKIKSFATIFEDMFLNRKLDMKMERIRFDFDEEDLSDVVYRSIWDIGYLVIMAAIFFAASFVAFLRYDVR